MCNDKKHCDMMQESMNLSREIMEFICTKYGTRTVSRSEKRTLDNGGALPDSENKELSHDQMQVIIAATGIAFANACADSGCPPQLAIPLAIKLIGGAYNADVQTVNSVEAASFARMASRPQTLN